MSSAARMQPENQQPITSRPPSPWVTILIMLLVYIITAVATFASVKTTTDEHTQQIRELQQNSVSRREMDDVKDWLKRIDGKLDKALERK
jgi:hypothetical protein